MFVFVHSRLLDERDLIDTGRFELAHVVAQIVGGADAPLSARQRVDHVVRSIGRLHFLQLLELRPQVGAPRLVFSETVQTAQRIAEELKAREAAADGSFAVVVAGETGHHADVRIHRPADWHTLITLDDGVVLIDPGLCLQRIDKGERQRANAQARGHANSVALGAGDPQRRMRALHRFRHDVAARHFEVIAFESGIRVHRQHVADLLGGLEIDLAFRGHLDAETAELQFGGRFPGAEIDTTIRHEVQCRDHFRGAGGMVVLRDHLADAVTQANALRALRRGREKHLWRGRVGVFLEEVVLDLPRVVDAQPVRDLYLLQRVLKQLQFDAVRPWPRQLMLVKNSKLHDDFLDEKRQDPQRTGCCRSVSAGARRVNRGDRGVLAPGQGSGRCPDA